MDMLNISKQDFKYILAACITVPLICFIAGFHIATSNNSPNSDGLYQEKILTTTTPDVQQNTSITKPSQSAQYVLQAGLFTSANNAQKLKTSLNVLDVKSVITEPVIKDTHYFRVSVGSFRSKEQAKERLAKLKKTSHLNFYVTKI